MNMARLWRDQGKRDEARHPLAPVYGWFTERFDTARSDGSEGVARRGSSWVIYLINLFRFNLVQVTSTAKQAVMSQSRITPIPHKKGAT
jgi:hypothetical protein